MPLVEHLEELRRHLFVCVARVSLTTMVSFIFREAILELLLRPPINWLLSFDDEDFVRVITADNYFTFVSYFMLAFGITFELPLVLTSMAVIGVVSSGTLKGHRAKILVGLWIASCFVTPGADPYSPLIVGVAFTILYFVSEMLSRAIGK
jgi:sec-independent protein translocase protein TatC